MKSSNLYDALIAGEITYVEATKLICSHLNLEYPVPTSCKVFGQKIRDNLCCVEDSIIDVFTYNGNKPLVFINSKIGKLICDEGVDVWNIHSDVSHVDCRNYYAFFPSNMNYYINVENLHNFILESGDVTINGNIGNIINSYISNSEVTCVLKNDSKHSTKFCGDVVKSGGSSEKILK